MQNGKYTGRKYTVDKYDSQWVERFNAEANSLKEVLGDTILSIEHIGSTSVPGLAGKPTIDILVTVENIDSVDGFNNALSIQGYTSLGEYVMEGSRLYVKEENNTRLVNLHFFHRGHHHIDEMITLRDYFRSHAEVVNEYSTLKFDLINKYPEDYGSYRKYKDEWMNKLKAKLKQM